MPSTKQIVAANNRRQGVAEMYLKGKSQFDIAQHFGVTQATISNDIKAIQKEWLKNSLIPFDEMRSKELAKIDKLELTYQEGYDASKTKGYGDPRFLAGLQWCTDTRLKIFGGYAAVKHEVDSSDKQAPDLSGYTFEQLYELKHGRKPDQDEDAD